MIYIFCALYCEAQHLIQHYQLKRDITVPMPFQVFVHPKEEVCLTVTGTGSIASAVAVSSVCTNRPAARSDLLVSLGTGAAFSGQTQTGRLYRCHKIIEQATGRTFYPDILFRHEFQECSVMTGAVLYENKNMENQSVGAVFSPVTLYDMEAAAVYQAGSYFFAPHQMQFLKLVSDTGEPRLVCPEQVNAWMQPYTEKIAKSVMREKEALEQSQQVAFQETEQMQEWFFSLEKDLCCSQAMRESLKQYIRYCILAGINYHAVVQGMYAKKRLPCKNRREGKECLEELKRRLL